MSFRRLLASHAFALGLLGLSACAASGSRGEPDLPRALAHRPRERTYDVLHYAIDVTLLPDERALSGRCRIRLQPTSDVLQEVRLDLVALDVREIVDDGGRALAFERDGNTLVVHLARPLPRDETITLEVGYGGVPVTGLWFSGERLDGTGPTQVFSHGQAQHSSGWFPCFDDPSDRATSELRVTMPADWVSVAAGSRIASVDEAGSRTEHWRMDTPHPSYLVTLVAGELVLQESSWEGIPLYFLAEPRYEDWIADTFAETDEILSFLSDYTAIRYPYPKYSQAAVANFPWGGMENISATTLTPLILTDERGLRDESPADLLCHEAAHQWFGDLLTCADWSHLWLNEGLATYLMLLYVEARDGVDEFRARMRLVQESYLEQDVGAARRPTVWGVWKEPEDVFDVHAYQGAAARLHLLRFLLGDQTFRTGLSAYASENAGKNVVTDDFQRALERVSGRDLDRFFEQWFHGRGFPEFRVEWDWEERAAEVRLEIEQVQRTEDGTPAVFGLPVEVELRDERGTRVFRLELDERRERLELPAETRPLYVRVDPHGWIPKRMECPATPAEWLAMARLEEDVNGRLDAVRALGQLAAEAHRNGEGAGATYVNELAGLLANDSSPWVRAAAAGALAASREEPAEESLRLAASGDAEARVRVAALSSLRAFAPDPELAALAEQAFEQGASWNTMGAAAGLLCAAAPERAFGWLVERLDVDSPHDRLCAQLLGHLAALRDARVPGELQRWAVDGALGALARAAALDGLARVTKAQPGASAFLADFLGEEDFLVRRSAVRALVAVADDSSRRELQAYYPRARTAEERRLIEALLERQVP